MTIKLTQSLATKKKCNEIAIAEHIGRIMLTQK